MTTDWPTHFARRTHHMQASAIRELLKVAARPEIISFAGGLPAPETFPVEAVAAACERILSTNAHQALQYAPTEGVMVLREQIAAMYRERGVPATVDNVLITTGSQQGLDLAGKTLINEIDMILTELPTYVGALQAWRPFDPTWAGIPMDDEGIQIEQFDGSRQSRTKLLYLLPNFQNPSGVSLSASRREKALELAHRYKFLIVEDDPYRALRYSGEDIPAMVESEARLLGSAWDAEGRVIHLGTFSKVMAPGLRIGWTLAPSAAIRMFVLAKQGADLHSSTFTQFIAEDLLRNGIVERNLPKLRSLYGERRDAMIDALQTSIGNRGVWTHPDGGLFVWLTLHGETDTPGLLTEALRRHVAFVPGDSFYFDGRGSDSMRLNFSCMPPDKIREGIRRLGELVTERQAALTVNSGA
jgi:2-aminoadipate transaminase